MEMMRKDASFFMEYACTKKNKVPQEFHFIYFLEINFALLFYSYCIIFKTSPLPIRYKLSFPEWHDLGQTEGDHGVPRGALRRGIAWLLFPIWLLSVSLTLRYFIGVPTRFGVPLQHRAPLSSLSLYPPLEFSKRKRRERERERERGDLLNCWLKSFASSPLRSYTRSESLKIEGRMGINVNKSGVYIDIIWLIYINIVSRCYCDYCIRVSIGNINEQVKTMHVDG